LIRMPCKLLFFLLVLHSCMFCSMDLSLLTILLAAKYVRVIIRNLVFKGTNIASKLVQNNVTYV